MPEVECQTDPSVVFSTNINGEVRIQIKSFLELCSSSINDDHTPKRPCTKCKRFLELSCFRLKKKETDTYFACCTPCNERKLGYAHRSKLRKNEVTEKGAKECD